MVSIREIFLVGIRKAGSQDAFAKEISIDPAQLSRFMAEEAGLKLGAIDRACKYAGIVVLASDEHDMLIAAWRLGPRMYERMTIDGTANS